jgi:heavy metal translocating P-type ATPase
MRFASSLEGAVERALLPLAVGGLVLGAVAELGGRHELAVVAWTVPAALIAAWLALSILRNLLAGRAGVDLIALLAIVGAILFGELLAASVIGVMLATGEALERFAEGRAQRELTALVSRAPRLVHRHEDGAIVDRPIGEVQIGDRILVKPGEIVPVDGVVVGSAAVLDESALTGESLLATHPDGDEIDSGTVNAGTPFDLRASATAERSTYAGIVRLVEAAQRERAPFVRLADRYALLFVPLTLAIAGVAWLISGEPVRALAVLVVATPCPLLLAAPIAIVAGISRSAKRGIIVKGGGALETIAQARVLLFDKTGTLTAGRPHLAEILTAPGWSPDEVLRLTASLEQVSPHVLAASIVGGARERDLALSLPTDVVETAGAGISGSVGGIAVRVGTPEFVWGGTGVGSWAREARRRASLEGASTVWVAIDGTLVGGLVLDDPIRPETPRVIRALRRAGIGRVVMVTGDHYAVADLVGAAIGVDGVLAERTPADKVDAVADERREARGPLVMVGDGINDAPALASADVGVAMGARGATASSEAADLVITVDRLDRLPEAIRIAKRSRSIALQSVVAGMSMSLAAMLFATTGMLPPVAGAFLQEAIDVVVILNALRALGGGLEAAPRVAGWGATASRMRDEHRTMSVSIGRIRALADTLGTLPSPDAGAELHRLRDFLTGTLTPHEEHEDRELFPQIARAAGSDDLTSALHRTHTEIFHLVRSIDRLVEELPADGPALEDVTDLRRLLYGLDAILRLHMAQEEELYLSLGDEEVIAPERASASSAAATIETRR